MSSHASRQLAATVGRNIKAARESKQLTQRELAKTLDTDPMQVSRWERGLHRPEPAYQALLAKTLFGGDLSALYDDHELEQNGTAA